MPQLDPSLFATQLFWLALTLIPLYLVLWKVALPRVGDVRARRRERIEDDLKKAEGLKAEAEAALAEYQAVIAQATQKAQDALRAAAHEASEDAARQREALSVRLTAEGDAAQARIEAESRRVIDDIGVIASELAQSAARRLAGADISPEEAVAAVAAAQREAG
ncbi:MAG: ATP synthase subunit b [Alphaproteobacteria bacterium MarineAlpha10_Bin3]|jgi:F-type H+-transporting ATPase subunit b|nr:MAG: ATP synthase subunit b [Alphaproteobacteria bacterium MarineAlpha10_Bin3]PPR72441.1 MAG: ATP synthase subunit b [Alphaproteobacteria bacterium MarineAlpha4_Bin1]